MESYCNLTGEQQGKLLSRINELVLIDDDKVAEEAAQCISDFIDTLVYFSFITPQARTKFAGGICDAMERRQKRRILKC